MTRSRYDEIAERNAKQVAEEKLKISFGYVDLDEEAFFFHGLEREYYIKFFECLTELQSATEREITEQKHKGLVAKSIFNTKTSIRTSFPTSVFEKVKQRLFVQTHDDNASTAEASEITSRAFEVRVGKNYGRVHGFVWNNIFHVVWIDPAHNLYPKDGKLKRHCDIATVRCFSPDTVMDLKKKLEALQAEYNELLDQFTAPESK